MTRCLQLSFLALVLAGCKPPEESGMTAIIGAVLIDGNGGPPITDSVVVVSGSRIRAAGSRVNTPIPAAARKINGAALFLIPGLIDLHVHVGRRNGPGYVASEYTRDRIEKNLNIYLYYGITAVRSIGADLDAAFDIRKAQRAGDIRTARLFTAGRGFTAKGGHPSQTLGNLPRQTDDPEDARRQVAELAAQQVDAIKIWVDDLGGRQPKVKQAVIEAILDESRKYKIPVTAHITTLADTRHLVNNGAAGFLHMIRDTEEIDQSFLTQLRALRVPFAPTLVRQELGWLFTTNPGLLDDPDVKHTIEPEMLAAVRAAAQGRQVSPASKEEFERAKRNSRRLASSGILIGIGSDGGSGSDLPGIMTHREMEILAEAGFSPVEVITAATRNGALTLGKAAELGTIEPGKSADLVLLKANPVEDVRNLRKIDRVMLNGEWIDRAALSVR